MKYNDYNKEEVFFLFFKEGKRGTPVAKTLGGLIAIPSREFAPSVNTWYWCRKTGTNKKRTCMFVSYIEPAADEPAALKTQQSMCDCWANISGRTTICSDDANLEEFSSLQQFVKAIPDREWLNLETLMAEQSAKNFFKIGGWGGSNIPYEIAPKVTRNYGREGSHLKWHISPWQTLQRCRIH